MLTSNAEGIEQVHGIDRQRGRPEIKAAFPGDESCFEVKQIDVSPGEHTILFLKSKLKLKMNVNVILTKSYLFFLVLCNTAQRNTKPSTSGYI